MGMTRISLLLLPTLEVDMANVAVNLCDFYQGLLGCDVLCRHNKALGPATIILHRLNWQLTFSCQQKKVGCIAITYIEPQEAM